MGVERRERTRRVRAPSRRARAACALLGWMLGACVAPAPRTLDEIARAERRTLLHTPIAGRCLLVGDSNLVFPAASLVRVAQLPLGDPSRPTVALDFAATIPGAGLRDLEPLRTRLADPRIAQTRYDCTIVNLGLNDVFAEREDFPGFFAGRDGQPSYPARVRRLLASLPDAPVYWIGVPLGAANGNPGSVAAVNRTLGCFERPTRAQCTPDHPEDARLRYVDPEPPLTGVEPRYRDGTHYSDDAGKALFGALIERILDDLAR